jgi:hypothetical protein
MHSHTILNNYFNEMSLLYKQSFGDPKAEILPFQKDIHSWLNYFYKSPAFRHIHLEYYKTDKISVLHSNIFPHPLIDIPILGFDMIALGDKITGMFFDFTPTLSNSALLENGLCNLSKRYKSEKRSLPEWANFFSDKFYCVTPLTTELSDIMTDILRYVSYYLEMCKEKELEYFYNIEKQNTYCSGQKKNNKTFKALAAEIGEDNAKEFLQTYLFPEIAI